MALFKFRVVLCRIRFFPTLISKIKWLGSGLPLISDFLPDMDEAHSLDQRMSKLGFEIKTNDSSIPLDFSDAMRILKRAR